MATNRARSLLDLPVELLVQIAENTNAYTLLVLSQVSRQLRAACNDPVVFLAICHDRNWAKRTLGAESKDVNIVSRYALAESRYLICRERRLDDDARTAQLLRYLVNVTLTGYSMPHFAFVALFGPAIVSSLEKWHDEDDPWFAKGMADLGDKRQLISFLFALGSLQQASQLGPYSLQQHGSQDNFITRHTYDELVDGMKWEIVNYIDTFHSNCMFALGQLINFLASAYPDPRQHSEDNDVFPGYQKHSTHVELPNAARLLLARSVLDIPLPMLAEKDSLQAWNNWLRRQRSIQSCPAYMDDCEWVGVYTFNEYFHRFPTGALDPPMTGIRFHSQPILDGRHFISRASGVDGVGEFDLRLSFGNDGYIHGTKAYRALPTSWSWHLSNTPLGLFGLWTSESAVGQLGPLGGAVWLWKREWIV